MGIEMLASGVQAGVTATFTFQNQVQAYVLGIWAFSLSYGAGDDQWVQSVSIKLLPSQDAGNPGGVMIGNQVSVVVQATLTDAHGHSMPTADSMIYVVCLADTGTPDDFTLLTNIAGIMSGTSQPVSLPGQSSFNPAASCLSGFNLAFSDNNQITGMSAGCGLTYQQSQGAVLASASIFDNSGNNAQTATVDAGVIVSTDVSPGFQVKALAAQTGSQVSVTMDQLTSVSKAAVMITSWKVQFLSPPHNVQTLSVGSWGPPTIKGNVVWLPNFSANIQDNSGNTQDDSLSSLSALVVALP